MYTVEGKQYSFYELSKEYNRRFAMAGRELTPEFIKEYGRCKAEEAKKGH